MTLLFLKNFTAAQGGTQVLRIPSLELAQGKVCAVVGPNGSGKTTLLLCMAGLLEGTGGSIFFKEQEIIEKKHTAELRRRVTMVFQEPLLFDSTVNTNIESGLRIRGIKKIERQGRVAEVAKLFGISHLLNRSARKLSGGESQRASLARAFVLRPELLLMDEPFSALDAPTKQSLLSDLGQILKQTKTTTVFSTHDLGEAACLADHLAVMNNGQLVQQGQVQDVLRQPEDEFVKAAVVAVQNNAKYVLDVV